MEQGTSRVVVGRQGIYDAADGLVGYELLFRGVPGGPAAATGDQMTAEVLYGALAIGIDQLVSGHDVYCNADRGLLVGDVPLHLPPERTVVEVLESVDLDDDVYAGCERLVDDGYRLAFDDFVWRPGAARLLPLMSVVKIDMLQTSGTELDDVIALCRAHDLELLAEKVEDRNHLAALRARGFTLFQGYGLERPAVVAGAAIESGPLSRLRVASSVLGSTDDTDIDRIERLIRPDPALALQLIQLASVGRIGRTRHTISTLREAIVLTGVRRIRNWTALLLARPSASGGPSGAARADRFTSTLQRARACELLVERTHPTLVHLAFAAGMLSGLAAVFEVSDETLLANMHLSDDLIDAAFRGAGPVGRVVRDVADFQLGNPRPARGSGVDDAQLHDASARALTWTLACTAALDTGHPVTGAA